MRNRRTMNRKYDKAVKHRNEQIKVFQERLKSLQEMYDNSSDRRAYLEECIGKRKKKINELFGIVRQHKSALHTMRQEQKLLRMNYD